LRAPPAYRDRGTGAALKLRSIALPRGRGRWVTVTANRLSSRPMLAINRPLGYVPGPPEVTYRKPLRPEGRARRSADPLGTCAPSGSPRAGAAARTWGPASNAVPRGDLARGACGCRESPTHSQTELRCH
jgi:hypothetical protein